jgi:hypothetical protein
MFDAGDDLVERIVRHLREPVRVDPALDARVMRDIDPPGSTARAHPWTWVALAAILAALLVVWPWGSAPAPEVGDRRQFVLVAPRAITVALVGDFNDWDPARTPMHATREGVWAAVVPLPPGRHRYAFLVDGAEWRADPAAPRAADDGFGAPTSVATVEAGGT